MPSYALPIEKQIEHCTMNNFKPDPRLVGSRSCHKELLISVKWTEFGKASHQI